MTSSVATEAREASFRWGRSRWLRSDLVEASIYLVAAVGVALVLADGALLAADAIGVVYAAGRAIGVVAAVFVMAQLLLISRAPFVDGAMGHDRAARLHTSLGKIAIIAMLVHAPIIVLITAERDGMSPLDTSLEMFTTRWFLAVAQVALVLFCVVFATSLVIVRKRWRYESWHVVHLITYVAVGLAIPHQFLEGSTFRDRGAAFRFWLAIYVVAVGSLLLFRVAVPLLRFWSLGLTVSSVEKLADGSSSITVTGRGIGRLKAKGGQFFLWRFLDRSRFAQAHPFSLSAAPTDSTLRLTVKPSGDGSAALADVAPGTRVMIEGPLGVFKAASRTRGPVVLVAAGIGVTPIRAMLEELDGAHGAIDVVLRVRSLDEAPLLDEVRELAADRGATLHVVTGRRDEGWSSKGQPQSLADFVGDVDQRDVFICGPAAWARQVEQDALGAGVARGSVHRELFGWHKENT